MCSRLCCVVTQRMQCGDTLKHRPEVAHQLCLSLRGLALHGEWSPYAFSVRSEHNCSAEGSRRHVATSGSVSLVTDIMRAHAHDASVQDAAFHFIIAVSRPSQGEAQAADGSLSKSVTDAETKSTATSSLFKAGVLGLCLDALRTHSADPTLAMSSCEALASVVAGQCQSRVVHVEGS